MQEGWGGNGKETTRSVGFYIKGKRNGVVVERHVDLEKVVWYHLYNMLIC